jgi:hypothetical protein
MLTCIWPVFYEGKYFLSQFCFPRIVYKMSLRVYNFELTFITSGKFAPERLSFVSKTKRKCSQPQTKGGPEEVTAVT